MAFTELDFRKAFFRVPDREIFKTTGKLVDKDKAALLADTERKDSLLADLQDNQFKRQQLEMQKKRDAAAVAGRARALTEARKGRLAQTAANDAMMNAMQPSTKDVITEDDARSSVMADPKILADIEAGKDSLLTPFMKGEAVVQDPSMEKWGAMSDDDKLRAMRSEKSSEAQKIFAALPKEESWMERGTAGRHILASEGGAPTPFPSEVSTDYRGQSRQEIRSDLVQEELLEKNAAYDKYKLEQKPDTRTPIVSTGEDVATQASVDAILQGEKLTPEEYEIGGESFMVDPIKEAGLITQQSVPATTDSMVENLAAAYKRTKDPRAKNAIAKKVFSLQAIQTKVAAENKKHTADLGKIKYKEQMKNKYSMKVNNTLTKTMSPENIQKFTAELPGLSDGGFFASIANAFVGNGKGLMTPHKLAEYAMAANQEGLSEAQIKSAMTTLSSNNWFFDNDVTESVGEFVTRARKLTEGKVVQKY